MYAEDDFLQLSGLQHFAFCRRQWALIHIEKNWKENIHTTIGTFFHNRAHNEAVTERHENLLIVRNLPVFSSVLGVSGNCDVVEFHKDSLGSPLFGEDGLWSPYPIEYKKGAPKAHNADELQLCCQAMCLEEMLCLKIHEGCLYYGETRHRTKVCFSEELRNNVISFLQEMHQLYSTGYTPKVKKTKKCVSCSLFEICSPEIFNHSAKNYLRKNLDDES